jgi:hypothetical protein
MTFAVMFANFSTLQEELRVALQTLPADGVKEFNDRLRVGTKNSGNERGESLRKRQALWKATQE